ncbi:MAG: branched-chain amino acid ABC transporter permease [Nitrospinota bacterium]|nr:MAG: branched-chain amino acid ABC transporter permease [Nitrospinota bacterium]
MMTKTRSFQWMLLALLLAFLLSYPAFFTLPFPRHLMIMIFLYGMLAQAWNILAGYCGQISLGNAVFFGIGAYTSTLLLQRLGLTPWIGMFAGAGVAVLVSLIIGFPCFRLGGHYFAIATIAIGEIVQTIAINWDWIGGATGLFVPILPDSFLYMEFHKSKLPYYYISLGFAVTAFLTTYLVERSRLGYYFRAIKEDPEAAKSLGIHITKYKLIAIALSAFFTAIGGTFYAQYVLYIDPDSVLPLQLSILVCLITVLGGVGNLWGPLLGVAVLIPLSEGTRIYLGGGGTAVDLVVYGALIMLISVFQPEGLIGLARKGIRYKRQG